MASYLNILYLHQYANIQLGFCIHSDLLKSVYKTNIYKHHKNTTKHNIILFRIKCGKLLYSPPLFNLKAVSIVHDGGDAEVKIRHPPVDKMEDLCAGPAVKLCFDSLRVCVRGELLAGVLSDQKQCIVLRVGDLEFVSAEWADLLCGCVRVDDQGFGRAARVYFLQGYTEIVLQRERKSLVLAYGSADRNLHNEWNKHYSWVQAEKHMQL